MLIYRWYPHGSKNLQDLTPLQNWKNMDDRFGATNPIMICHDQEPLDYTLFDQNAVLEFLLWTYRNVRDISAWIPALKELSSSGLRSVVNFYNIHDKVLLLHSEQNSTQLETFRQWGMITVYYWSHALIARDWFRYAQHDPVLLAPRTVADFDFLIYNRAWSGVREYRLAFAQELIERNLVKHCLVRFASHCDGQHYSQHQYRNAKLAVSRWDLEQHFEPNNYPATASADYHSQDYRRCNIEVVLETLMDDTRWHLTEKTLRPIACGQPFMLVSTPGALDYLRYYGFQTFYPYIDETYDSVLDARSRIRCVQAEMSRIAQMDHRSRQDLMHNLRAIAEANRQRFFSPEFQDVIIQEYHNNLYNALAALDQSTQGNWVTKIRNLLHTIPGRRPDIVDDVEQRYHRVISWCR